jgi:hypothetical protein
VDGNALYPLALAAVLAAPIPTPIGRGPRFLPPPRGPLAQPAAFRCRAGPLEGRYRAHVELFALRRVVIVPRGIGVRAGACRYPARTLDPTGVVDFDRRDLRLRDLFAIWRQPFGPSRLLSFRGSRVIAFVGGKRWRRDPGAIPLRDRAEIVVEIGGYVPPHSTYLFPPRRGY